MSKDSAMSEQATGRSYIWPMKTVWDIRRLHVACMIDRILIAKHGESVMDSAKDRLVREFQRSAEPWAVVPHPQDFEFREVDHDDFAVKIECAWRPATNIVQMHGGPSDGQVIAVQRVGDPIEVVVAPPVRWSESGDGPVSPTLDRVAYRLDGWSETAREWVYRP